MIPRFVLCLITIFSLCLGASARAEDFPLPVGWDDMSAEKKEEYAALWADFREQRSALKLTEAEEDSLTRSEKRAHYQAMWSLRIEFQELLTAGGFEIQAQQTALAESAVNEQRLAAARAMPEEGAAGEQTAAFAGTIVYDSGVPTVSFGTGAGGAGGGAIIGNRFSTHTGNPVLNPGTVSTIQAVVVPGPAQTTSSAGFVLLGPQTTMGGAMALFSTFTGAASGATVDTVTFTGLGVNYTGSSFYVLFGDFSNSYVPAFGTGTNLGQGHHGVAGHTGGMGPNITATTNLGGNLNALIRATGNIISSIPVELMKFEVEGAKPE